MSKRFKIATCQLPRFIGSREELTKDIVERDSELAKDKTSLAVYPWTYVGKVRANNDPVCSSGRAYLLDWLDQIAKSISVPTLLPFSAVSITGEAPEIAFFVDGKAHLLTQEKAYFLADAQTPDVNESVSFMLDDVNIGVACTEVALLDYSEGAEDVDIIMYIPYFGVNLSEESLGAGFDYVHGELATKVEKSNAHFVCVNGLGFLGEKFFYGMSFAANPQKEILSALPMQKPHVSIVDIFGKTTDNEIIMESSAMDLDVDPVQAIDVAPYYLTIDAIDQLVRESGSKGVEILLTDKFPSYLLVLAATAALGPERVGVTLTTKMSQAQVDRAFKFCYSIGIKPRLVPDAEWDAIVRHPTQQSNLTGAFVAAWAHENNRLYISSADKTALLFGDEVDNVGCADFAPFANIVRSDLNVAMRAASDIRAFLPRACFNSLAADIKSPFWTKIKRMYKIDKKQKNRMKNLSSAVVVVDLVIKSLICTGRQEEPMCVLFPDFKEYVPIVVEACSRNGLVYQKIPFALDVNTTGGELCNLPLFSAWNDHSLKKVTRKNVDKLADKTAKLLAREFRKMLEEISEDEDFVMSDFAPEIFRSLVSDAGEDSEFFNDGLMSDN